MEPRNDYELLKLGQEKREGTPAELRAWVDDRLRRDIESMGTREAVFARATAVLENIVGQTGVRRVVLAPRTHGSCTVTLAQTAP